MSGLKAKWYYFLSYIMDWINIQRHYWLVISDSFEFLLLYNDFTQRILKM